MPGSFLRAFRFFAANRNKVFHLTLPKYRIRHKTRRVAFYFDYAKNFKKLHRTIKKFVI